MARPLTEVAHRLIERHGVTCRGCGLGNAHDPVPGWDLGRCVGCGRELTGLVWSAHHVTRPIRTWLFGA